MCELPGGTEIRSNKFHYRNLDFISRLPRHIHTIIAFVSMYPGPGNTSLGRISFIVVVFVTMCVKHSNSNSLFER